MRVFLKYQFPLVGYAALVFAISSIPQISAPDLGIDWIDKIAHGVEYLLFFLIALRAFRNKPFRLKAGVLITLTATISLVYAISDEIHQYYVPGRSADILDILADMVGILAGMTVYFFWIRTGD